MLDNEVASDPIMDSAAFLSIEDANIAALHHRHQQHGRGPPPSHGGHNGSRGFNPERPVPCKYTPCGGRSHPPNVCCVCDAPTHRVGRCWYIQGLPSDRLARVAAFKQIKDAGDAPFARPQVAAIDDPDGPPVDSYDNDVQEVAADVKALEAQFHPGYDFPPHSSAIDYFDSLDAQVSALDQFDCDDDSLSMPDLCLPGDPGYDSDSSVDCIPSSRYVAPRLSTLDLQGDGSDSNAQDPDMPDPFTDRSLRPPLSLHDGHVPLDIARGFLQDHKDWYVPPDITLIWNRAFLKCLFLVFPLLPQCPDQRSFRKAMVLASMAPYPMSRLNHPCMEDGGFMSTLALMYTSRIFLTN
jgi:hypothetical protein